MSPLKEGGGRLSVLALRACSYMSKAEGCHQGLCPHSLQGVFMVFVFSYNFACKRFTRNPVSAGKTKTIKNLAVDAKPDRVMMWPAENI